MDCYSYRTVFCICVLICNALISKCQQIPQNVPGYDVDHYSDESALPQNSVKSIVADAQRNIWLATEGGLVRFDGQNFIIFDNFGGSFSDRNIFSFLKNPASDAEGFFALNNEGNHIRILNGKASLDDRWYKRYLRSELSVPSVDSVFIADGTPNPNRAFIHSPKYLVMAGSGRYFMYDKKFVQYFDHKKKLNQFELPDKSFWDFFRLNDDLYFIEDGIITRFSSNQHRFAENVGITGDILENPLFGEKHPPLVYWNNCSNQVFFLIGRSLYAISQNSDGQLTSQLVLENFDLEANHIKSVYHDQKTQRIFLGSLMTGLYVFKKKSFKTLVMPDSKADNVYYGLTSMGKSTVLTNQGYIFSFDLPNDKIKTGVLQKIKKAAEWDKSSILTDRRGNIWCKRQDTVYQFDSTGQKLKAMWRLREGITQLYQARNGKIWIGSRYDGLYWLDPDIPNSKPILYVKRPLMNISWIHQGDDDTLWIATGKGLFKVHLKNRRVSTVRGLEKIYVRSLYMSGKDQLWITTYKDGLFLLQKGRLTRFPLDKRRYLANAHCIVEDKKGFMWITTNKGLFQILQKDLLAYVNHKGNLYYHYYTKSDGFNSNEFNGGCQPCAVRLSTGHMAFPSMNGIVTFIPEQIKVDLPDNGINVDSIDIDGKSASIKNDHLIFRQNQKVLRLYVSTPYFGNAANVHFSYVLMKRGNPPASSDWLSLDANDRAIYISQLSNGNYVLHIRKNNGFGQENYSYKTVHIIVPPLWWQTWWFYLTCALGATTITGLYVALRINSIRRRNALLEMQIKDRTEELEKSQSDLIRQIHLQSRLMASIAHDVRSPLNASIVVTTQMQKLIKDQQYEQASALGESISSTMRRIKDSLEGLLGYVKASIYKRDIQNEPVLLFDLIEKSFTLHGQGLKMAQNTFINQVPKQTTVSTNAQLLHVIIHNVVDNANKYTDNGVIRAYVHRQKNGLALVIEDSGEGIPEQLCRWFNDTNSTPIPLNYNGIGFLIIKELTPFVIAGIQIERLDLGSKVTIHFSHHKNVELGKSNPVISLEPTSASLNKHI